MYTPKKTRETTLVELPQFQQEHTKEYAPIDFPKRNSQFQKNQKATLIALPLDAKGIYTFNIENAIPNFVQREWELPHPLDHYCCQLLLQTLKNKVSISTHSLLSCESCRPHPAICSCHSHTISPLKMVLPTWSRTSCLFCCQINCCNAALTYPS